MSIAYIQLLPTVFVRADAFPGLQAFQAAQAGLNGVYDTAAEWDDEPTRPDIPIPNLRHGTPPSPTADLPTHVERALMDRYEVEPREISRLRGWMREHGLRAGYFSKAVEYLSQMRRAAAEETLDDEPTVRIDLRKQASRKERLFSSAWE